tara:strand:- start:256 stop:507 length:252 start_codon:yes stop_codon:yes gene_type:complete
MVMTKKHNVYIEDQDLLLTEAQILKKLDTYNNTHTTELFIDDNVKGNESNFSNNFLEKLNITSNSHYSINLNNQIDNVIISKQ